MYVCMYVCRPIYQCIQLMFVYKIYVPTYTFICVCVSAHTRTKLKYTGSVCNRVLNSSNIRTNSSLKNSHYVFNML